MLVGRGLLRLLVGSQYDGLFRRTELNKQNKTLVTINFLAFHTNKVLMQQ